MEIDYQEKISYFLTVILQQMLKKQQRQITESINQNKLTICNN